MPAPAALMRALALGALCATSWAQLEGTTWSCASQIGALGVLDETFRGRLM